MTGPLPAILQPLTRPASWGWRAAVGIRNRRFDRGRGVHRLDCPVLSVGNLTTGGTGKTPLVRWIVERLRDAGHRPAVLLRGYGSRDPQRSDEAQLYRERLTDVPVLADPDRVRSLQSHLLEDPATNCAVLDDGFQHRRLHRDLDLVLVDATVPIESMRMLPAGHLREPLESLRRAHGVIITRSHGVDEALASRIEALHGKPPLAWTEHRWSGIEWEAEGVRHSEENAWLEGKRFVCRLGVGNPGAVRAQLLEAGAEIVEDIQVRDHAPFGVAEVQRLVRMGDAVDGIFMTAKDRVKAQPLLDAGCTVPLVVPQLQLRFHSGQAALVALLEGAMSG